MFAVLLILNCLTFGQTSIQPGFAENSGDLHGIETPLPEGPQPIAWPWDKAPVISLSLPLNLPGVVVAAPHDGFDSMTGEIASEMARILGCGLVVARGFRVTSGRLFFNVNRPTRSIFKGSGRRVDDIDSGRARILFETYSGAMKSASGLTDGPVGLYVEIHGHSRKVKLSRASSDGFSASPKERVIDVIEIASVGIEPIFLRLLKARMARDFVNEGLKGHPGIFFDVLDPEVTDGIVSAPFRWKAEGAKTIGILSGGRVERALHIELPPSLRLDAKRRRATAIALTASIGWLIRMIRLGDAR